jgi:hypothetical protein
VVRAQGAEVDEEERERPPDRGKTSEAEAGRGQEECSAGQAGPQASGHEAGAIRRRQDGDGDPSGNRSQEGRQDRNLGRVRNGPGPKQEVIVEPPAEKRAEIKIPVRLNLAPEKCPSARRNVLPKPRTNPCPCTSATKLTATTVRLESSALGTRLRAALAPSQDGGRDQRPDRAPDRCLTAARLRAARDRGRLRQGCGWHCCRAQAPEGDARRLPRLTETDPEVGGSMVVTTGSAGGRLRRRAPRLADRTEILRTRPEKNAPRASS